MTSHGNLDGHPLNPLNHFLLEELRAGYKQKKQESFHLFSTDVVLGNVGEVNFWG